MDGKGKIEERYRFQRWDSVSSVKNSEVLDCLVAWYINFSFFPLKWPIEIWQSLWPYSRGSFINGGSYTLLSTLQHLRACVVTTPGTHEIFISDVFLAFTFMSLTHISYPVGTSSGTNSSIVFKLIDGKDCSALKKKSILSFINYLY